MVHLNLIGPSVRSGTRRKGAHNGERPVLLDALVAKEAHASVTSYERVLE